MKKHLKKITALILSIIQFVNVSTAKCLENLNTEIKNQDYKDTKLSYDQFFKVSVRRFCEIADIELNSIAKTMLYVSLSMCVFAVGSVCVEFFIPELYNYIYVQIDRLLGKFVNTLIKEGSNKEKVENLNLIMVHCNMVVCLNGEQSGENIENNIKILEFFLDKLLKNSFEYIDIDVDSLDNTESKIKFSDNVQKFYDNAHAFLVKCAFVVSTEKCIEKQQRNRKEILIKLDDWKKKMDSSKIDKK